MAPEAASAAASAVVALLDAFDELDKFGVSALEQLEERGGDGHTLCDAELPGTFVERVEYFGG